MTGSDHVIYIVDDDEMVLGMLRRLFTSRGHAVRTFSSAEEFLQEDLADLPSCLLLDVRMPRMSGLELQDRLLAKGVRLPIIFITGHGDVPMAVDAMKKGAVDFLQKPFKNNAQVVETVRQTLSLDVEARRTRAEIAELRSRRDTLTPREREVMGLVVKGLLNKQIAGELGTSEKTIKVHRGRVMEKMQAGSLADLVRMAERLGEGGSEEEKAGREAGG